MNEYNLVNNDNNVIGITDTLGFYAFWCAGCGNAHGVYTVPDCNGNYFTFNNDLLYPTFKWVGVWAPYGYTQTKPVGTPADYPLSYCRFDINDGIITYHNTCSHNLAGMSVPMIKRKNWGGIKFKPDIDEDGYKIHKVKFDKGNNYCTILEKLLQNEKIRFN